MSHPIRSFGERQDTLYLLDISSFIFRAFFAIRALHNRRGEPTNAVYGVASMVSRLVEEADPAKLIVTYDSKEPSFRHAMYDEYKANRSAAPEELVPQFARIDELVRVMGIHSYRQPGVEADDLIASLTRSWCSASESHRVVIVSGDKDLMQLVDPRVRVWDTMADKIYGPDEVKEKFGVGAESVRDYLSLIGDSSDNIPGVEGIGPKTAVQLLQEFGDMEGVLKAAAEGKVKGKRGETLKSSAEVARLSQKLVTLKEDLDLKLSSADLHYEFGLTPECAAFLQDMDFGSLLEKWKAKAASGGSRVEASAPAQGSGGGVPQDFRTVRTEGEFTDLLQKLERSGKFAVDLETTSLDPFSAEIVGVALCHEATHGFYVPVGHRGDGAGSQLPREWVLSKLKPLLLDKRVGKVGQNIKYDLQVFRAQGLDIQGIAADTMVAAYVADPSGRHNMDALSLKYLEYKPLSYEEVCGKGKDEISFADVPVDRATRYSAEDALVTYMLWDKLEPVLKRDGLVDVFQKIDLPLVPILAAMEMKGVRIDVPWLQNLSVELERDLKSLEERVHAFTDGPLNLNSPKQLGQLLFEKLGLPPQGKTKTGYSTDASVLEALADLHEVPRLLLEYREISKLKGTYVDPLPEMVNAKTGRIHAGFHQTVAATGRLSSSDPNLQNIPIRTERGRKIRRAFLPSEGGILLSADYSQIELRILAHMSKDADLSESFRKGEDVHRRTASEIFHVAPEKVDDRQRGIAKAINFGLMYGKTAFGLAQELKIPRKEAKEIIDAYFARYSAVKEFLDGQINEASDNGYVTTLSGRRRGLPDIRSKNPAIRAVAERMAMNTPIQGTAADLMKLAMIGLDQALREGGYESKVIIQVHDELVLDCVPRELEDVRRLVISRMENAMSLSVPLIVNSESGSNWMDL